MARRFEIMYANTRQYRRYNAVGMQLTGRLIPPSHITDPVAHDEGKRKLFSSRSNNRRC